MHDQSRRDSLEAPTGSAVPNGRLVGEVRSRTRWVRAGAVRAAPGRPGTGPSASKAGTWPAFDIRYVRQWPAVMVATWVATILDDEIWPASVPPLGRTE